MRPRRASNRPRSSSPGCFVVTARTYPTPRGGHARVRGAGARILGASAAAEAGIARRMADQHPTHAEPEPPFPEQEQEPPGRESDMQPLADHGEKTYVG